MGNLLTKAYALLLTEAYALLLTGAMVKLLAFCIPLRYLHTLGSPSQSFLTLEHSEDKASA